MDGLSQQSEQEQEAMRLQAQDEQQQSDQLQSNILREIEELETQELNISANEELVLKRLKEVERHLKTSSRRDASRDLFSSRSPIMHLCDKSEDPSCLSGRRGGAKESNLCDGDQCGAGQETGQTQVVSAASITPETVQGRGLKVYDDGRKSVYALHPEGGVVQNGAMTPLEVEELLRQATDQDLNTEVQYHPPVYSAPYTGNTRPSTPRTPSKRPTPTPSPSLTENQQGPDLSRAPVNQDPPSGALPPTSNSPAQSDRRRTPQCDRRTVSSNHAALVSVTAQAGGCRSHTAALQGVDTHSPSVKSPGAECSSPQWAGPQSRAQDQSHHWDHDLNLDLDLDQDQLLRPTFTHKTRSRRGSSEMKLCSTGR
ncbi:hypothetical protein INR49_019010 [Caranx melampygus]|nr:hypothetical protein INR49_019010 [Caranx melampygus]